MASSSRAYFEQQRESLIGEIATSFEHVLANINKLNRNLEAVIAVGNEFSSVEALWSTFENVMAKEEETGEAQAEGKDSSSNNNNNNNNNNKDADRPMKVEADEADEEGGEEDEEGGEEDEEQRGVDHDGDVEMG